MNKETKRFKDAFNGLKLFWQAGIHEKFHFFASIFIIAAGLYCSIKPFEWMALFCCIGLVLIAEMLNTALEKLCDFIHPKFNQQIGNIKDIAAAAVLVTAFISIIVGCLIFVPKIFV